MAVSAARQRALAVVPILAGVLLLGGVTRALPGTALLLVAALGAGWRAHALTLNRVMGTALAAGGAALAGIFLPTEWLVPAAAGGDLSELSVRAAFALLLFASLRLLVTHAQRRGDTSVLFVVAAAVACGQAHTGWVYPALVCVVVVSVAVFLQSLPDGGPRLRALGPRKLRTLAVAFAIAAASSVALIASLPWLHARMVRVFYNWDRRGSTTGISGEILLGGAADISESNALVLRIHGPRPDYLRGVVFNRYRNGRWVPGESDPGTTLSLPSGFRDDGATSRVVATKIGPRYFVPLGASGVGTPSGMGVVDRMGALRALPEQRASTVWFRAGGKGDLPILPPSDEDREIPPELTPRFRSLASEWTAGAPGQREQLEAIEQRLRTTFQYSLKHTRSTNADPVVDFLWVNRVGHCEYFATAMALLGRSLNIPTRVVSGFRVGERNPVGDFYVARDRDAHAWVEAWVDGQWTTFDPTPPSALSASHPASTPWLRAVFEWSGDRFQRLDGGDIRAGLFGLAGASAGGAALLFLFRRVRRRRKARGLRSEPLVPSMAEMFAALAARGMTRGEAETLEAYVRRLRDASGGGEWQSAGDVIEQYARLLYGGIGRSEGVEDAAARWLKKPGIPGRERTFAG